MLIITTSNSPPPIAVEAVILARAWFSDSVMNLSLISGFSASNLLANFRASVIWEFDTIAMVTVLPTIRQGSGAGATGQHQAGRREAGHQLV